MTTTTRQATRRMSLLDTAFVNVETRDTPMHIGGLQIFHYRQTHRQILLKILFAASAILPRLVVLLI